MSIQVGRPMLRQPLRSLAATVTRGDSPATAGEPVRPQKPALAQGKASEVVASRAFLAIAGSTLTFGTVGFMLSLMADCSLTSIMLGGGIGAGIGLGVALIGLAFAAK